MIDSDVARRDLLVKVAKMYYQEERSQQEIAREIEVSRPQISRMLKTCRDLNIVEIRINESSSTGILLQQQLVKRFQLSKAIVASSWLKDIEHNKERVGEAAAHLLEELVQDKMTVGISWGSSLYYLVEYFSPQQAVDAEVVQLIGGIGARDLQADGLELARNLSRKLNGICHVLQAPLFVQSTALRDMLMQEPDIFQVLDKGKCVDIAVIGVGTIKAKTSALVRAGYMSKEQAAELEKRGAVGDVLGQQIDRNGNLCNFELNQRTIGLNIQQLKQIPTVIGVASGVDKANVIRGAIKGGLIKMLVTDEATAMKILNLEKYQPKNNE
ncbi:transcriptional regulator [candidate division KSB3 bacterium]|uniref:Transcriptional regulator n=1 Tax=candidate division KSB3 bacterium TaxID=2044937 RepID=A0A2G6KDV0_9BACT|nr:MAG: transcriptional regulator [candidate division KSB3 bacterium]